MKTIGLIGGMSWESSAEYYRLANRLTKERLGGQANARSLLLTVNFAEIEKLQHRGDWGQLAKEMVAAARQLQAGGADFIVLCTNTMHKLAPEIEAAISIPFLHIADATGTAITAQGMTTVGLLGTRFTMEESFYRDRLQLRYNLKVVTPDPAERDFVHHAIYDELCQGILREETRMGFRKILQGLVQRGAQGIILGCTELGLLLGAADCPVPLFDTTQIHAQAAVDHALA
jgi:aspartate racemase